MTSFVPVILCGGSGSRLWPLSRSGFPKQFLCLSGDASLFQQTALRMHAIAGPDLKMSPSLIVTSEDHRFLASEQWRELNLPDATLVLEPRARNTAPALTLAALAALETGDDPVMVVSPADQVVEHTAVFVDVALASEPQVVFNGGTHSDAVCMRYDDYAALAHPVVGSFATRAAC